MVLFDETKHYGLTKRLLLLKMTTIVVAIHNVDYLKVYILKS